MSLVFFRFREISKYYIENDAFVMMNFTTVMILFLNTGSSISFSQSQVQKTFKTLMDITTTISLGNSVF